MELLAPIDDIHVFTQELIAFLSYFPIEVDGEAEVGNARLDHYVNFALKPEGFSSNIRSRRPSDHLQVLVSVLLCQHCQSNSKYFPFKLKIMGLMD